jgi:hypothetical protein
MGAWGFGNFQNDAALEWVADLVELPSAGEAFVRKTLRTASSNAGELGANACCAALAAGEVVAIALGRPPKYVPEQLAGWMKENPGLFDRSDADLASAAAAAIEAGSELQELFDEGEPDDAWHAVVQDLLARLKF